MSRHSGNHLPLAPRTLISRLPSTAVGAVLSFSDPKAQGADRGLSWQQAACITAGDFLGIGFLLIPSAFSSLGYAAGTIIFAAFSVIPWYTSSLLRRFKQHLLPSVSSYQDAALHIAGPRAARAMCVAVEFGFVLSVLLGFSLAHSSATSLLELGLGNHLLPAELSGLGALVAGAALWPLAQIRTLSGASWTSALSSVAVLLAAGLALAVLANDLDVHELPPEGAASPPPVVPPRVMFLGSAVISPILAIILFYYSHDAAFEVMDEMQWPAEYQRAHTMAYCVAGPLALAVSLATVAMVDQEGETADLVHAMSDTSNAALTATALVFIACKGLSTYQVLNVIIMQTWLGRIHLWADGIIAAAAKRSPEEGVVASSKSTVHAEASSCSSHTSAVRVEVQAPRGERSRACMRVAQLVRDSHPRWLWAAVSSSLLLGSMAVSVGFPFLGLLGDATAAIAGVPIVFILPAWFFLRGSQLAGEVLRWWDRAACYTLVYVLGPVVSVLGLLWVVLSAIDEYSAGSL